MERQVCIGGNELSNPCRTHAYVTTLGHRCWTGSGEAPCCDCDGEATSNCDPAELFRVAPSSSTTETSGGEPTPDGVIHLTQPVWEPAIYQTTITTPWTPSDFTLPRQSLVLGGSFAPGAWPAPPTVPAVGSPTWEDIGHGSFSFPWAAANNAAGVGEAEGTFVQRVRRYSIRDDSGTHRGYLYGVFYFQEGESDVLLGTDGEDGMPWYWCWHDATQDEPTAWVDVHAAAHDFAVFAPGEGEPVESLTWHTPITGLLAGVDVTAAKVMTLGMYEVGAGGPCPEPDPIPDALDEGWTDLEDAPSLPVTLLGSEFPLDYPADDTPGGTVGCRLVRLDIARGGEAAGSLFLLIDGGDEAAGARVLWAPAGAAALGWQSTTALRTFGPAGEVVECPDEPIVLTTYTDPATDDAPWYDAADARSVDVLGVWLHSITLSSPHRQKADDAQWGGTFGPLAMGRRELTVSGRVYVRTRAAAEYARHWLYELLVNSPCAGGCSYPDVELLAFCNAADPDDGVRFLHECALIDWQWDTDPDVDHSCWVEFTATLASKKPWLTKLPTVAHDDYIDVSTAFCDLCGNMTSAGECPERVVTDPLLLQCGCADQPARAIATAQRSECYVRPMYVSRYYVAVSSAKLWTDGALRFTITGGTAGLVDATTPSLKNLRIRAYSNPQGYTADQGDELLCGSDPCADVQIGCVPYGATMVVDGSTRRAWVELNEVSRSARPYLSSGEGKFVFPEYSCGGLMLAIDVDPLATAPDCRLVIETVEVERG